MSIKSSGKPRMGRPSIFRGPKTADVHGAITKMGKVKFEDARRRLAAIADWVGPVSDAAVIEFLARGEDETKRHLEEGD